MLTDSTADFIDYIIERLETPVVLLHDESLTLVKLNKSAEAYFEVFKDDDFDIAKFFTSKALNSLLVNSKSEIKLIRDNVGVAFEVFALAQSALLALVLKEDSAEVREYETTKLLQLLEEEKDLDGKALAQVLASEQLDKLKLISEHSLDVICLHHPADNRYLYASPSTKKVMGYTMEDLKGRVPFDFIHPQHLEVLNKNLTTTSKGGNEEPEKLELLFRRKDSSYRWYEGYTVPIKNKSDEVILYLSCTREIQDRKRAELERAERERLQQYTVNQAQLIEVKKEIIQKIQKKILSVEPAIRKELDGVLNHINASLEISDPSVGFSQRFQDIYPEFYNYITTNHPEVTNNELQHLALIRLGMTSDEISRMLSIKKESLRVARNRIKNKLKLSQDEDLLDFVTRILS